MYLHILSFPVFVVFLPGGAKLLHISCGFNNVWAVDNKGMVYLRIGIKAPLRNEMSPAWVPVDGSTHHAGGKFLKVITGPMDWMVSDRILMA